MINYQFLITQSYINILLALSLQLISIICIVNCLANFIILFPLHLIIYSWVSFSSINPFLTRIGAVLDLDPYSQRNSLCHIDSGDVIYSFWSMNLNLVASNVNLNPLNNSLIVLFLSSSLFFVSFLQYWCIYTAVSLIVTCTNHGFPLHAEISINHVDFFSFLDNFQFITDFKTKNGSLPFYFILFKYISPIFITTD